MAGCRGRAWPDAGSVAIRSFKSAAKRDAGRRPRLAHSAVGVSRGQVGAQNEQGYPLNAASAIGPSPCRCPRSAHNPLGDQHPYNRQEYDLLWSLEDGYRDRILRHVKLQIACPPCEGPIAAQGPARGAAGRGWPRHFRNPERRTGAVLEAADRALPDRSGARRARAGHVNTMCETALRCSGKCNPSACPWR
jgi:hypothetical protein